MSLSPKMQAHLEDLRNAGFTIDELKPNSSIEVWVSKL